MVVGSHKGGEKPISSLLALNHFESTIDKLFGEIKEALAANVSQPPQRLAS